MSCRFSSHLVAQICRENSVSLEPNRSYPGGGYILWKRQLGDKQGQRKGGTISVQQSQHQVILHSPSAPLVPLQHHQPLGHQCCQFCPGHWENEAQGG